MRLQVNKLLLSISQILNFSVFQFFFNVKQMSHLLVFCIKIERVFFVACHLDRFTTDKKAAISFSKLRKIDCVVF